ncbi:Inositol-3,4-bisphosphate 4-phosphatase [Phytophthora palmivora]|uniref:Inositol-3,4-bisphosphate 4-phosphatase n=1 Tax=Phytophthora palmivora TaxID=4796 RepID=A0A2P4X105_9STRA|nr:Inositol-3,4-bisphosphate 4-phosphatase [Phytophthora palmivora]
MVLGLQFLRDNSIVRWLNSTVSFKIVESREVNPIVEMSKCVEVKSTSDEHDLVAVFAVPPSIFSELPEELQQGECVKVLCVLFTQGVNEPKTMVNFNLKSSLEDDINFESVQTLQRYFRVYRQVASRTTSAGHDSAGLNERRAEIEALAYRLDTRGRYRNKKHVNTLIIASDICYRLGAGRTTCCDNGKGRTAMSVTLEMTRRLVDHLHVTRGIDLCNTMRERGVRRVNEFADSCIHNKYQFDLSQLANTPECYLPPPGTTHRPLQ